MKKTLIWLPLAAALSLSFTHTATAGFGDFIKNLEDSGKEVLDKQINGGSSTGSALPTSLDTENTDSGVEGSTGGG